MVQNTSEQSHRIIVQLPDDERLYELQSISGKPLGVIVKSAETWVQPQNLFLKVLEGIFKRESVLEGDAALVSVCVREWSDDDSDMDDEGGTNMVLAVNSQMVSWLSSAALGPAPTPSEETEKTTCRPSVDEMIRKKKENQERRLSTSTSEVEVSACYEGREQSEMRDRSEPPNHCEDDGLAFAERQELQNEKEEYMANRSKIDGMAALFQGIADFTESVGLSTEDLVECFERAGGSGKVPSLAAVSGDEVAHKFLQSREGGCSQQ